jgi:RNA polymerase sigma-70 factor, ECF subfamily
MDERELIQKSQQGDEEAFAQLMYAHQGMILRHCLSLVHDQEIAEDLTQEAFVQAYRHLARFRMEAHFSTWVWRIAHNLALNYLKKHRVIEQEFQEGILHPHSLSEEGVTEEYMSKIRAAMERLPAKHRVVFEMFALKRIPQKQIAATLGLACGTVRSRLHYARKKIKKFLQGA